MMLDVHGKLNPVSPWQKQPSTKGLFHQQIGHKLSKKLVKC